MKRHFFTYILLLFFGTAVAQQVPQRVQVKFRAKYPQAAEGVRWSNQNKNYLASFTHEGYPLQVTFSENGQWQQTRTTLSQDQWPELSRKYLEENHAEARYLEGYKYETPQGTRYNLKLQNPTGRYQLDFDGEGGFVNEEPAG